MRKAWKNAQAKDLAQFTMRDINMVIAEVRAERNPANYKPVKMTITVTKSVADWLKQHAAELHCSVEELVNHAVSVYRRDERSLAEDREYFALASAASDSDETLAVLKKQLKKRPNRLTKAISESAGNLKTGRYER